MSHHPHLAFLWILETSTSFSPHSCMVGLYRLSCPAAWECSFMKSKDTLWLHRSHIQKCLPPSSLPTPLLSYAIAPDGIKLQILPSSAGSSHDYRCGLLYWLYSFISDSLPLVISSGLQTGMHCLNVCLCYIWINRMETKHKESRG